MNGAWKQRAAAIKRNTYALYLAARDPRVPILAKIVIGLVVAYALSPIDLIPDFIPVIGFLDDLVLLPLGIWLALRLMPMELWREFQAAAETATVDLPRNRRAAVVIVIIWFLALLGVGVCVYSLVSGTEVG